MKTIGLLLPGKLVSDLDFTAGAKLVNGPSGGVLLVFQHQDSGSCSSCRKKSAGHVSYYQTLNISVNVETRRRVPDVGR
jgi:hypothetical protein